MSSIFWIFSLDLCFSVFDTVKTRCFCFYRKFKGTLMQIWKSPYMFVFIWKQYPANSTFLILRIIELFAREVCKFPKNWANFLIFNIFHCFSRQCLQFICIYTYIYNLNNLYLYVYTLIYIYIYIYKLHVLHINICLYIYIL